MESGVLGGRANGQRGGGDLTLGVQNVDLAPGQPLGWVHHCLNARCSDSRHISLLHYAI